MAAEQLGVSPAECLVIEDSRNGLRAAHAAGMKCLVTVSGYARSEDFSEAALVVTCLNDLGGEQAEMLANRSAAQPDGYITVGDLERILGG
jgi:beta-phosphoglucomutase-like phosphatase (HAD superfamily)